MMCYNVTARNIGFGVEAERKLPAMDYYARLLELLSQLPSERQKDAVWLSHFLETSLGQPERPLPVPQEEAPDAPQTNDSPTE